VLRPLLSLTAAAGLGLGLGDAGEQQAGCGGEAEQGAKHSEFLQLGGGQLEGEPLVFGA
jgi:hypothetical protein